MTGLLLGGEALPRGGVVRLGGDLQREIMILPVGTGANWNPVLLRQAAGNSLPTEISSRDALALWFCISAEAAGVHYSLALSPNDAAPALIMKLPG
jgi:hypothetical protein